ncbi:MAG: Holliday junction branch migration protein RuvA [Deltaproteobacteria bacterium]|nr:Holliday junction branch migration protein RuvA [Deltaproteobacteria bacterium]
MIAWLKGAYRGRDPDGRVILDVGGVGYALAVPLAVLAQAEAGQVVELFVHTHVREDEIALFGFDDEVGVQAFRALLQVSGVGPKVAIALLGALSPGELAAAVGAQDVGRLALAKGVGKRLAERLAVELKGKLDFVPAGSAPVLTPAKKPGKAVKSLDDLRSALVHLEFRPKEVEAALADVRESLPEGADFDTMLRRALALLRK